MLETNLQLVHHLSSAGVPGKHGADRPSCTIQQCHLSVLHQCCCSWGILPACGATLMPQPFAIAAWETAAGQGPGEQGAGKWRSHGITQAKQEPALFLGCWVRATTGRLAWIFGGEYFECLPSARLPHSAFRMRGVEAGARSAASLNGCWKKILEQTQQWEMRLPVFCQSTQPGFQNHSTLCNLVDITKMSFERDLEIAC